MELLQRIGSFHLLINKFVKNGIYEKDWCNIDDKYHIKSLDLE